MKKKKRYEFINENDYLVDNEQNTTICDFYELTLFPKVVVDLLNQQNKRIKELEKQFSATEKMRLENLNDGCKCVERDSKRIVELQQENQQLKDQARKAYQEGLLQKQFDKDMEIQELKDKIEQLKQSQKQLAINELQKLSKHFIYSGDEMVSDYDLDCDPSELKEEIEQRIKSLKGEK